MNEPDAPPAASGTDSSARTRALAPAGAQRSVMVIESNVELQNILRERLKSSGYRVLVTQDPERAMARFVEDPKTADCVMFCATGLGEPALEAFNRFGEDLATQTVPALLLLAEKQKTWKAQAKLDKHRVVISMPIKMRELRDTLAKLLPAESPVEN
jgi:CheY-like chemotaxis protein